MQCYIEEENGQRHLVSTEMNSDKPDRTRILTEEEIENMSKGSLRGYIKKIRTIRSGVHACGTPQAVKTVDYLWHTSQRAYNKYDDDFTWPAR